jgi:hypothetical protein
MDDAALLIILAPLCAVGGWAIVVAASRIEARRKEHHAKRFATLYFRDIAAAPTKRPRNLIRASGADRWRSASFSFSDIHLAVMCAYRGG